MNDRLEIHAKIISHHLLEHADVSKNFASVVEFLAGEHIGSHGGHKWDNREEQLSWQGCPPYVLNAVLIVGMYWLVPQGILMSDELLPTIARILRDGHEQG